MSIIEMKSIKNANLSDEERGGQMRFATNEGDNNTKGHVIGQGTLQQGECNECHCHDYGEETIIVTKGQGIVDIDGTQYELKEGSSIVIGEGRKHELKNTGEMPLEFTFLISPLAPTPELGHTSL